MEILENVPLHTRRPSIMELVSCVAGLWLLDCGLDTVRGSVADADTAAMSQKT